MPKIERTETGWRIVSDDGLVLRDGMTNAQAWKSLDLMQNEPVSASQVEREMIEKPSPPSQSEKQDFFSGLIQIAQDRGYKDGWAWHKFCEKFGHTPDGLHRLPCKPSSQVWGWLNRRAIAKEKERKYVAR